MRHNLTWRLLRSLPTLRDRHLLDASVGARRCGSHPDALMSHGGRHASPVGQRAGCSPLSCCTTSFTLTPAYNLTLTAPQLRRAFLFSLLLG